MTTLAAENPGVIAKILRPFAELCYNRAKTVITLTLITLGLLISQIPNIPIDVSTEGILHEDDPVRVAYDEFKSLFGRDDAIILSLPISGEMDNAFFTQLAELQNKIENGIPYIDKVTSLINARVTRGEDDELIVEDLLEDWSPQSGSAINSTAIKNYVLSQPHYVDRLISRDGKFTALIVEQTVYGEKKNDDGSNAFLDPLESQKSVQALKTLIAEYPELDIALSGQPVVLNIVNVSTMRDSSLTGSAALFVTILFMIFFFRRLSGVLLPLVVINGSMIGAMGVMGVFKAPFTLTLSSVFPLMIAVGVADAVHILSHFYRNFEESGDKKEAILKAVADSGPAVLMTSLTTAVGFLSFTAGDLASTADLGIYAAIAVLLALYFTLILLPSCIALFNIKQIAGNGGLNKKLDRFLARCGDLVCHYPKVISLIGLSLMAISLWAVTFLHFLYDPISRFPDDVIEKIDNTKIDEAYQGVTPIEIIIDTQKPRGILTDNFLAKLVRAEQELTHTEIEGLPLGSAYSVLNILRETHKALNNNITSEYRVTEDAALAAQELLLFEMSNADDLRDVVDSDLQTVRMTLSTRHADGVLYDALIGNIEQSLNTIFGTGVTVTVTGSTALLAASVPKALKTMAKSYVVAAVLIILLMMIMVRNIKIGLISIVPNLLPILIVMAVMVLMDWPLDMTTILVGAIAMGIVVDDTLHFLYHFKLSFEETKDASIAVRQTLRTTGPALFITTIIFATGASANMLSPIDNIFIFGFTMWLVTVLALLSDILIAPALLVWAYKKKAPAEEMTLIST